MKSLFSKIQYLFILTLIISCSPKVVAPIVEPEIEVVSPATASFDTEKLDAFLQALYDNGKWRGAVTISEDSNVVYDNAWGQLTSDGPVVNENTLYRAGSITKMYTSTQIFQLAEEGKLKLTDKLSSYFPDVANSDKISIDQLLNHHSGIFNYTNDENFDPTEEVSKQDLYDLIASYESQFEPGSEGSYSNSNYILLGGIIEQLDDRTFKESLQTRILSRINANETTYLKSINSSDNETISYQYTGSEWIDVEPWDLSQAGAAGAIAATGSDLHLFIQALMSGKLISAESLAAMKTLTDEIGHGIFRFPFNEKWAYGHSGGLEGFRTLLGHFDEENVTASLLSNGLNYNNNDIMIGVLSIVFGEDFEIPSFETVELSTDALPAYIGEFASADVPLEIKFFDAGGVLNAQATGQGAFPLTAESDTSFSFAPAGVAITFSDLVDGKYQQFTLNQAGQRFTFNRK